MVVALMGALVVASAPVVSAAVLDRDTGYDPEDVEPRDGYQPPDVSSTTRRLAMVDGRRVLAVIVRFYKRSGGGRIEVRLDSQAGRRVDHLMLLGSLHDPDCWIWPRGDRGERVEGRVGWRRDRLVCRTPAMVVRPDKPIRGR